MATYTSAFTGEEIDEILTKANSPSYNDLSDTPIIPVQEQADWNESDSTARGYIKNKPTISSGGSISKTVLFTSATGETTSYQTPIALSSAIDITKPVYAVVAVKKNASQKTLVCLNCIWNNGSTGNSAAGSIRYKAKCFANMYVDSTVGLTLGVFECTFNSSFNSITDGMNYCFYDGTTIVTTGYNIYEIYQL